MTSQLSEALFRRFCDPGSCHLCGCPFEEEDTQIIIDAKVELPTCEWGRVVQVKLHPECAEEEYNQ